MRKNICFFFACLLFFTVAAPNAMAITDDKVQVYQDGALLDDGGESFILNGATYVPLRSACEALGATDVNWDAKNSTATVSAPGLSLSVQINSSYMVANGRYLYMEDGCKLINGSTMVPLRQICKAFGAGLEWKNGAAFITTGSTPISSGDSFYNSDDVYWLARIINAEAGNESFEGKIAVGNVIMNRVADPSCPDTVYEVIFDRRYGIQFTPAYSGAIYNTPNADSVIAAKIALEGTNVCGDSLYFVAEYAAAYSWAGQNRPFTVQIGNHCFYA